MNRETQGTLGRRESHMEGKRRPTEVDFRFPVAKVFSALHESPESNQQGGLVGVQELCDSKKQKNNKEMHVVITGKIEGTQAQF